MILKTPEDYAAQKDVTLQTVYNWIKAGKVQTVRKWKKTFIVEP